MNFFIDIDIDIDIFKSDLIDIDIDIDIFRTCRYIDNRYGLSIYRTPLVRTYVVPVSLIGQAARMQANTAYALLPWPIAQYLLGRHEVGRSRGTG